MFLISCGGGKTYFYELNFVEDKDRKTGEIHNAFIYDKKGNAFDGIAWSSDGKTLSIKVDNGLFVWLKMYYKDGKLAAYSTLQQQICYNRDGDEITQEEFKKEIDSESLARIRMASEEMEKK